MPNICPHFVSSFLSFRYFPPSHLFVSFYLFLFHTFVPNEPIKTFTGDIESLNLGRNRLMGTLPPAIGAMTMLRELVLGVNELTGTIPQQFLSLTNLGTFLLKKREEN